MDITQYIRAVPDFPTKGILFRDITPLLQEPAAFHFVIAALEEQVRAADIDAIVGIESRGFIFAAPLALRLGLPFIPIRKPGKLPAAHMSIEYSLEYGAGQLDIHADALRPGQRALIVDDLLATGGTARAAAKLVELLGATVAAFAFVLELQDLRGRDYLEGYAVVSLARL